MWPLPAQDAALAVGCLVVDLAIFWDRRLLETSSAPAITVIASGVASYMALVWRRHAPVIAFVVMWLDSLVALQVPGY